MTSSELRERLGLSRSDWARALNVQEITVKRWEDSGTEPGGTADEVMRGIVTAIAGGVDAHQVGIMVNLGGIRSLVCYALTKRAQNGHGNHARQTSKDSDVSRALTRARAARSPKRKDR